MRALLTGGHGFVGSHLVDRLLAEGTEVHCLYRRPGLPASLDGKAVQIVPGDVRNPAALRAAVEGMDEVYHLAALTRALTRTAMFQTNLGGTEALLGALAETRFAGRFVFCSSISVVGPAPEDEPHNEAAPLRPITWYGQSKASAEAAVNRFGDRFEVTTVRPPAVYGPRDTDFLSFFQAVSRGLAPVLGGLDRQYSMVHAQDLAAAMFAVARSRETVGRTYFANHPRLVTQGEMIAAAEAAIGRSARRLALPVSLMRMIGEVTELGSQLTGQASLLGRQRIREIAAAHWICRPEALSQDTGWRAEIDVEAGFQETVAWYRANGRLPG